MSYPWKCRGLVCLFLAILSLATTADSVQLRGRGYFPSEVGGSRRARHLQMQKDPETLEPVVGTTAEPSAIPTPTPPPTISAFSAMPSDAALVDNIVNATASPTAAVVTATATAMPSNELTPPPTEPLPANARRLYPFTLRIEGNLADESIFRQDVELHMLSSMKNKFPSLTAVFLEPTPVSFGQRGLQQATLLGYIGYVTLDATDFADTSLPTTEDIQQAQLETLENPGGGGLQDYLTTSSTQPVTILQVQVADFDAINFVETDPNDQTDTAEQGGQDVQAANTPAATDEEKDNKTGMAVGIVVAICAVAAVVGFFVRRELQKPPPPPPYEFDQNEEDMEVDDIVEISKSLKVAITESTTDSEGMASPKTPSPANSSQMKKADEGMEVIALSKKSKRGVIDLRKPAKHSNGIESVIQEKQAPVKGNGGDADDSFDDSLLEVQTIVSNADDSMAGYSLATDGPEGEMSGDKRPVTPKGLLDSIPKQTKDPGSPEIQNKAQMRWFHQEPKVQSHRKESSSKSSPKTHLTLEKLSDPLRDSMTGMERDTEVFMDDDDDEVEVVSRTSEDYPSSYKEDDSVRGGSVMSGMSNSDYADGEFVSPDNKNGALGYFYREQEEEFLEDFDVLPKTIKPRVNRIPDDVSDVPSDERNNDRKGDQDLSGFSKFKTLQRELDGITGTWTSSDSQSASVVTPPEGSWEDDPEMMEAWVRERRRLKRQARNRREERKQPPLTMEI